MMSEKDEYLEKEFNFRKAKKNPYAKLLKKQITININNVAIEYFKAEAERTGIPYQTLINLYLTDCAENKRKINIAWK